MSEYSRVTSKGTITIPAEYRAKLGITPGQRLQISLEQDRVVVEKAYGWADLDAFRAQLTKRLPAGLEPLTNVHGFVARELADEQRRRVKR